MMSGKQGQAQLFGVAALVLLAAGCGLAYFLLRPTEPELTASRFLRAWKMKDTAAMAAISIPEDRSDDSPVLEDSPIPVVAPVPDDDLTVDRVRVAGPASLSGDIATVPAVADINGRATVGAWDHKSESASLLPSFGLKPEQLAKTEQKLARHLAFALNGPLSFKVCLVRQGSQWKVDRAATLGNCVQAVNGAIERGTGMEFHQATL